MYPVSDYFNYHGQILREYHIPSENKTVFFGGKVFLTVETSAELKEFSEKYNLRIIEKIPNTKKTFLVQLPFSLRENDKKLMSFFSEKEVEPDFYKKIQWRSNTLPDDPYFDYQWYIRNDGQTGLKFDDARIFDAWSWIKNQDGGLGANVRIGIIDNGFDLGHEDLSQKFLRGYDIKYDDDLPEPMSDNGHGTAVAGIAAAETDNGIGISGVCPECFIVPVKISGNKISGEEEIKAFNFLIDRNVDIISNSWGPPDNAGAVHLSGPLEEIMEYAVTEGREGKGITIIFAAGNGNESISDEKTYDGYASSEHTIAVGASNGNGMRTSYSDFGETLDILAPSCDIDVDSFYDPFVSDSVRHGIWTTDVSGSYGYTSSNYEPNFCGTSASAPIVAGLAGLILSVNPDLTRKEVYEIITDTADKISPEDADYDNMNGHSETYGYGRINARAAVEKACGDSCVPSFPIDEEPYYTDIDFKPEENFEDKTEDVDYEESIVYKSHGRGCSLIF